MKKVKGRLLIASLFAMVVTVGGCSVLSPQRDRSRFFVLTASANSQSFVNAAAGASQDISVGLGPITIPRYLDRPEVVTRISQTELAVSDTDRWAEPLKACVASVLAQDLSIELPSLHIVSFPWPRATRIQYGVSVKFLRLERTGNGKAEVQATWTIRRNPTNTLVQRGTTSVSRSAGADQSSTSAALSAGVAQVAREIAQALAQQPQHQADRSNHTSS